LKQPNELPGLIQILGAGHTDVWAKAPRVDVNDDSSNPGQRDLGLGRAVLTRWEC